MIPFHPFKAKEREEEPEEGFSQSSLRASIMAYQSRISKFLKASGQTRLWRNSPKLRGAGVLCALILLASWRGSHEAQWHPDLHQLGFRVPPCRPPVSEANPPFPPRDPRNVVLTVSPYAVCFIWPPAGTLSAVASGVRKHHYSVSHPSHIHSRTHHTEGWDFIIIIKCMMF